MLFSYSYCRWQNQQWRMNAPRLPAISMVMAVRLSNTDGIAQCGMSRATPEATRRCHCVTTCYVSPQRPPGQQANKQQSTNTPKKVAVLMAMAMRRYVTARIARWRKFRASLEATGRRHQASIMSDNINWTWLRRFFWCFHRQNRRKRSRVDAKTPVFSRGMTYQSKQKGLTKVSNIALGGLTDIIAYARVVILLRLCLLEQCWDPVFRTSIKTGNFVSFYEFLIHVGVHHTRITTMPNPNQVILTLTPAEAAALTNAMASSPSCRAQCSTTGASSTSSTPTEKPPAPALPGKHQSKKQLLFEQIEAIDEEPPQLPPQQLAQPPLQPPALLLIQQPQQNVCDWAQAIPCKFPSLPLLH